MIQHHMPRNSGGVSPTFVSDNRQTNCCTSYGISNSLKTCSNPSQPWLGKIWKALTKADTEMRDFVAVQPFQGEISLSRWKKMSLNALLGDCQCHPSPKAKQRGAELCGDDLPHGGKKSSEQVPGYLSFVACCWQTCCSPAAYRHTEYQGRTTLTGEREDIGKEAGKKIKGH